MYDGGCPLNHLLFIPHTRSKRPPWDIITTYNKNEDNCFVFTGGKHVSFFPSKGLYLGSTPPMSLNLQAPDAGLSKPAALQWRIGLREINQG